MKHLAVLLSIGVLLAVTTAKSQTKFLKYEGNPILDVGPPGSWDAQLVEVHRVLLGDTSKLWYTGSDGSNLRIGYAWSTDSGFTWTKHPRPVLSPTPGRWDGQRAGYGYVIRSASGYKTWYSGYDGATWRIGFATAINETLWVKRADPVLGPGPWSSGGVAAPSVVEVATGGYKLWYQGVPAFAFGYAEAADETTWTPSNSAVFSDGGVYYQRVIFDGQLYRMWYTYHGGGGSGRRIKYATSSDGISWTIHPDNPVLSPGPASWETSVAMRDIHFDGRMYHLWYEGLSAIGSYWRSGYAVSPKGMTMSVSGDTVSVGDTIWVRAQVDSAAGLSFIAVFKLPSGTAVDSVALVNDSSGVFTNFWIPAEGGHDFDTDLKLLWNGRNFRMHNALTFFVWPTGAVGEELGLPKSFSLEQNYPNPFNPATVIRYSLPANGRVMLKVYSVLGQEVETLVNEVKVPGSYEVTWDARGFASGVYYYRLQAGSYTATKKLLLIR